MNKKSSIAVAALSVLMLGSCNVYKKYECPTDASQLAAEYAKGRYEGQDTTSFGTTKWQDVFTDPVLVDLINQALANNMNLQNAKLNVDMAQAQLQGAKLAYLPSLSISPNGAGASMKGSDMSWTYQIPATVSWEVDIFGKLLNSKRGAQASVLMSQEYEQAVRSQIIAGVATSYYSIAALEEQLILSRNTAELWKESVQVMKDFKLAGRVTEAAVVQSTAQYYSILAQISDLEVSIQQANNALSLLLNVLPQTWNIPAGAVLTAPADLTGAIAISQLSNRPDVRAAEANLAVAYYATNSARAAFYPSLQITANGGFTNMLGSMVSNPGHWFIQLAGQLTAPIFSRGANITRYKVTKAQQQQALNEFEYSILSASAEVSNAMTLYEKSVEKSKALAEQTDNLKKSVDYTQELLRYGTTSYLEVLTAQQNLLGSQMGEIGCKLSQSKAVINMYQALGGGK